MKRNFYILLSACVGLILTSCMDNDTPITYEVSKDAQIYDFSVSNDSIEGLGDVKFSIDQLTGLIYNRDSLPFGTKVEDVICSITTKSASKIEVKETYPVDTTFTWKTEDSVNFAKPVVFNVYAADLTTSKSYKAFINIHQINPDSMFWDQTASGVFGSAINGQKTVKVSDGVYYSYVRSGATTSVYKTQNGDMSVWAQQSLIDFPSEATMESITRFGEQFVVKTDKGALYVSNDGLSWTNTKASYPIISVLGAYTPGQSSTPVLSVVVSNGNQYYYAVTSDLVNYKVGGKLVAGFPIKGFASYTYTSFYNERLMLAGGKDINGEAIGIVWSSMSDGTDWAITSANNTDAAFGRKEGVAVTQYGNSFYLLGGITATGDVSKEIYTSSDFGYSWSLVDTLIDLPDSYKARGYLDATTVGERLYLIGGRDNTTWFDQVWSGFLLNAAEEIRANNK
ncbi:MAG: DUF6242 domain-containing protein [Tannerellaceae bacterium]